MQSSAASADAACDDLEVVAAGRLAHHQVGLVIVDE